jgi:S-adenosylmethionine:tRNA ribosyltransferase-isomerase
MAGGATTADYDFELPPHRIAQHPAPQRDEARLLIVDRATETLTHGRFSDLVERIPAGDVLVLNTSRVIRARLLGTRERGGRAEVLLLAPRGGDEWEALVRPGARLREGQRVQLGAGACVVIGGRADSGTRVVRLETSLRFDEMLDQFGHVPLPPYINRSDTAEDAVRYQTVYAREPGSIAAPTAGLHFTDAMLAALEAKGVRRADVVLHVGPGTFKPVETDDPAAHVMHRERFAIDDAAVETLNAVRKGGGHVWAVGTTSMRVLESVVDSDGRFQARSGETELFIRPPHVVRGADRLVTNFHLPRSTLLMLVAAFAGYDLTRRAYDAAIAGGYRFYSYGDAMCVV